jgi:diguanylate cyclase (GGDEF)-like protein/PAS domain S-box-containing protein/putative nucleotidyltransferase with HDIG domain
MMKSLSATARITLGLVALVLTIVLFTASMGMIPDGHVMKMQQRLAMAETVALNSSTLVSMNATSQLEWQLETMVERHSDLKRIVVSRTQGGAIVDVRDPNSTASVQDMPKSMSFPLFRGAHPWGSMDFYFSKPQKGSWSWLPTAVQLSIFVVGISGVVFYLFLNHILQHLDPNKAEPDRVRTALDTLAEGLIVIDENERIVLANEAFSGIVEVEREHLLGKRPSQFGWVIGQEAEIRALPWVDSLENGRDQRDISLSIQAANEPRVFRVNSTTVRDADGAQCGVLATFNDITAIEKSRTALRRTLEELCVSRDEIQRQNTELKILATSDPLTGCLNRRSFFEKFDTHWQSAQRYDQPLTCVMVDIDHFKSVNDTYGHAAGDDVLREVGRVLREEARDSDLVCRYGGEEFVAVMPSTSMDVAFEVAERYRLAMAALVFPEFTITASLGVGARCDYTSDPQSLMNEADKCLYVAKRNGRNQVVRRDAVPDDLIVDESKISRTKPAEADATTAIPFPAVTALFSALAYRDSDTAEHSRRVADLVAEVASGFLPASDVYVLEVAALLHDIGKIGVPDAILLKAGPLTEKEWQLMKTHERIGVEIVHSAFCCDELSEIVRSYHAWYDGRSSDVQLPKGQELPVGARLMMIADAFDSMTSDTVYRKGRSYEEGFKELLRYSGKQFDPELVERFIRSIARRQQSSVPVLGKINKQAALQLGSEMQRLAETVDARDFAGLQALAARLGSTASKAGVTPIAEAAEQLDACLGQETDDLKEVLNLTQNLISLCRATQRTFLDDASALVNS